VIALSVWCVLFLVGSLWLIFQAGRSSRLEALYRSGSAGDFESIRRLAEENASDSRVWLEKLAHDRNTFTEYRVAAINALRGQSRLDSDVLAALLWIEQPFDVRHAVASTFDQRGCDDSCVSATLYALHALWQGQPTAEVQFAEKIPATASAKATIHELRIQSERDYFMLLNGNPCKAKGVLDSDYSGPNDSGFVTWIREKLRPC
jgi:hypothetical protein